MLTEKEKRYSSPADSTAVSQTTVADIEAQGNNDTKERPGKLITNLEEDDPKKLPLMRKWIILMVICSASLCVACGSSVAGATEAGVQRDLNVSHEVSILGISLYVVGLGLGPLFLGPLSEFYGRNSVYWWSYGVSFLLGFPVAFANNAPVYLIFRFFTGMAGAAFLSVAGGSVSDLFDNQTVALPLAVYTVSPFIGPVIGPAFAGFISQHTTWRWTYYVITIWTFIELWALILFVPETYGPTLLQRRAERLRKETGDESYYAPLDVNEKSLLRTILVSCYFPFKIMIEERMALLLDIWAALMLGILYLTFQAFPIIFGEIHGFSPQFTGLTFLGIGLGMVISLITQPLIWNKVFMREVKKYNGSPPPESRLLIGMAGAIITPISLFWLAFTTYRKVHWIVPIIASVPFGTGIIYAYTAIFTFLVTAYRPNAASALAGNSFVRSAFAASFPLFAGTMYHKLGSVGATALLAGLTVLMIPLPFIFYKYGAHIRRNSKFTDRT
ncbi:hypothetical protein M422DRAFT_28127 [Sphaerobolus stellatus SS14]|nr:hypothetical protein M422DRAFT_28127 [Sphaerobolus stellatus SS14]